MNHLTTYTDDIPSGGGSLKKETNSTQQPKHAGEEHERTEELSETPAAIPSKSERGHLHAPHLWLTQNNLKRINCKFSSAPLPPGLQKRTPPLAHDTVSIISDKLTPYNGQR